MFAPSLKQALLCLSSFALCLTSLAQWENMNPGAGGQIQSVDLDPNIPGRAYYSSDMEGAYRTDDYGASWQLITENSAENNILFVRAKPGNSNHLFMGQLHGFERSLDGGRNWERATEIDQPIMFLSINPQNTDELIAAPGARMRWRARSRHVSPLGTPGIYRSSDGGKSWQFHHFETGVTGRKDVFTVYHNPAQPTQILAGSLRGVYLSENGGDTWQLVDAPAKTGDCWGACWSPDGKQLFATYRVATSEQPAHRTPDDHIGNPQTGLTHLFSKTADGDWIDLSANNPSFDAGRRNNNNYWMPESDCKSSDGKVTIALAPVSNREGLTLVHIENETASWERIFFYDHHSRVDFDTGWEHYSTRPLSWEFTPASWPNTEIWTTGDQTMFRGSITTNSDKELDQYNSRYDWQNIYTRYVQTIDGVRFYRTRGAQCTFIFDGEAYKNYSAQSNGDNAIKESYDSGYSWAVGLRLPRSNAIQILRDFEPPIVLAHTSSGYGGSSERGALWYKRLEHMSPKDKWIKIGGEPAELGGLPDKLYNQIIQDPHHKGRVYIGTRRAHTWMIEDIEAFIRGEQNAVNISADTNGPFTINDKGVGLSVDPHDPNVLWGIGTRDATHEVGEDLFKGTRQADGVWSWEVIRRSETTNTQIAVWDHLGSTGLGLIRVDDHGDQFLEISIDGGINWQRALDRTGIAQLRATPEWLKKFPSELYIKGLTAKNGSIALAYTSEWSQAKGYGVFFATLEADGTAHWTDFTGDHPFPYPVKQRLIHVEGHDWLYMGSKGAGWWRRPLD
ncbi:Unannotated [Lentimonas sp. CC4]|uniref:WD40/YVTN/BNR-like repeat-containing protein n=2 Tax=Lentimonas TaxID=417293 RepID=UPI0013265BA0|nr:hypothetical protein [Lentimonas sp. CC4]CAA6687394.1 Unannotated [Lentimonas sp. CC6]CAA7172144.1 Unannotated [Lentimonas sp. CC21]CAA7181099.1 Unannotated [Lentimonas sp. CC8]CAA6680166.1 Unannotated [Lentimonas sp. CC4]CAA7076048.1 Unannotated [Lentimonas sp. CC4]